VEILQTFEGMMAGAPRVTDAGNCIEYDYGEYGITVHFGLSGHPSVKYRSGQRWSRKLGELVHAEQWREGSEHEAKLRQITIPTVRGVRIA
jgi:hypothetical protein